MNPPIDFSWKDLGANVTFKGKYGEESILIFDEKSLYALVRLFELKGIEEYKVTSFTNLLEVL